MTQTITQDGSLFLALRKSAWLKARREAKKDKWFWKWMSKRRPTPRI